MYRKKVNFHPTIGVFPRINLRACFCRARRDDPILCSDKLFLYSSGRSALYAAARACGLPAGSRFLMPAFHCGVEVEATRLAGYDVDFYNIKPDLVIDFDDLVRRVNKNSRALVIIHYFGLMQEVEKVLEICNAHRLILIEDCAHALYSSLRGKLAGLTGDFGVYSLRKSIGLPDGGALLCNLASYRDPQKGKGQFEVSLFKSAVRSVLEYEAAVPGSVSGGLSRFVLSMRSSRSAKSKASLRLGSDPGLLWQASGDTREFQRRMCGISRGLLRKESYSIIVARRRLNYRLLDEAVRRFPGVVANGWPLEEGACPLCYVIDTDNRDRFVRDLRRRNVSPYVFGASPHPLLPISEFPHAAYLRTRLMGLPVHQQLSEQDLGRIVTEFREVVAMERSELPHKSNPNPHE
jgi:dTDP-4-amino-4,6-dideoxygalactose transaminase